jgi:hypothetical protein
VQQSNGETEKEVTMKSSILRTLVVTLGLSAAFGPIALMAQDHLRISVPFDFTVGTKSFAAGQYSVERLKDSLFVIRNVHDHTGALTFTRPGEELRESGQAALIFNRYGESYFLSRVCDGNRHWELQQSAGEKEQIAKRSSPKPVSVAAALPPK